MKPAQTLHLRLSEGSFIDVDVSPDGKTLAFDLLGNLYTVPVTGGNAKQLTNGMAINFQPVWSPNGKQVACISDYSGGIHLNIIGLANGTRRILGGTDRQLQVSDGYKPCALAWKKDGSGILTDDLSYTLIDQPLKLDFKTTGGASFLQFGTSDTIAYYAAHSKKDDWMIEKCFARNAPITVLGHFPSKELAASCVISPDESAIAFLRDTGVNESLMIRNIKTGAERLLLRSKFAKQLLRPGVWGSGSQPQRPRYCFSPDAKFIYIGDGGKLRRIEVRTGANQIIPFTASVVDMDMAAKSYHIFPISHQTENAKYTRYAQASPDGHKLLFTALNRIYVKELPNGKPRMLLKTGDPQFEPGWSPDGKRVTYVTWNDTAGGALWEVSVSGKQPELLSKGLVVYRAPVYAPDGETIAFIRGHNRVDGNPYNVMNLSGVLCLINRKSKEFSHIRDSVKLNNNLLFAADGREVNFQPYPYARTTGTMQSTLAVVVNTTKSTETIATAKPTSWDSTPLMVSPDGRYIVFSKDEDLYLIQRLTSASTELYDQDKTINGIRFAHGIDAYWEKGGKVLSWSYGNHFYRIDPDKIMQTAKTGLKKVLPPKGLYGPGFSYVDIKPDQVISLDVPVSYHYAHGAVALTDARIITMKGHKVIGNGTILIKNGRIAAVGKQLAIPRDAQIIDVKGKTIIPGFVDLHLHLHDAGDIFPNQYVNYLANLAYGVTTARDPSSFYNTCGLTELLRSGQMIGPRLYSTGRPVRYYDGILQAGSLGELEAVARKRKEMGFTFTKQYILPDRQQRQWLSTASRKYGLNMTNEGSCSALEELAMVKDGSTGIEHAASWGDLYKDYLTVWGRSGVYFTPTLLVGYDDDDEVGRDYFRYKYWHEPTAKMRRFMTEESLKDITSTTPADTAQAIYEDVLRASRDYAKLRHAGAKITLGSHGEDQGIGVHNELWALQMGGLTNLEALQAATIMGAEAIGIQKDVGSIEVGKIADLIILNSNPIDDIHNSRDIKYVMKDGILYDGDTLDEVWPLKKKCPDWRLKTINK